MLEFFFHRCTLMLNKETLNRRLLNRYTQETIIFKYKISRLI